MLNFLFFDYWLRMSKAFSFSMAMKEKNKRISLNKLRKGEVSKGLYIRSNRKV